MTQAEQVRALVSAMDTDGDGVINLEEFLAATAELQMINHHSQIWAAFCKYDRNGDGVIDATEARLALGSAGNDEDAEAVTRYIAEYDADGDGKINLQEFIRMLVPEQHTFSAVQIARG